MEKVVYDFFHKNDFDEWIGNFALNLNDIWNEPSARDLDPTNDESYDMTNHSAIVIGKGPSLKKNNHLQKLIESNYSGTIICTDGALINVLKSGVTPDLFPNFFVVTIEPYKIQATLYDDPIIEKFGTKIKGIFSTLTHPDAVSKARKNGIKIHWLHTLFDYNEGKKSINNITSLMVRTKKNKGLPAIQTGGNVGTSCWFVGWKILGCSTISLIGMNHGWEEDDPIETIMSHGQMFEAPKIDKQSELFKKLFPKVHNPEFNSTCILDPIFQYYSSALKEFISRAPSEIRTINATEGGSLFGEKIHCMPFTDFLKNFDQ
ncbi:DUF115 domain-containing protein [Candidatus Nitrosopumilus sp. SW]|nr:DUF115 domain-containing protein [Candidatus Nitrosopumilus sp. SW]